MGQEQTKVEHSKSEETPAPAGEKFFALSRCRYSSDGEIVTAEAGDEIIKPNSKDLQDLIEHGAVETFDPGQVQAILSLKSKNPEAKKRLAKLLGF
jgi:hypothetical protein